MQFAIYLKILGCTFKPRLIYDLRNISTLIGGTFVFQQIVTSSINKPLIIVFFVSFVQGSKGQSAMPLFRTMQFTLALDLASLSVSSLARGEEVFFRRKSGVALNLFNRIHFSPPLTEIVGAI